MKPFYELAELRSTQVMPKELQESYKNALEQYDSSRYRLKFQRNFLKKKQERIVNSINILGTGTPIVDVISALMNQYMDDVLSESNNYVVVQTVSGGGLRKIIRDILHDLYKHVIDRNALDASIKRNIEAFKPRARQRWVGSGVDPDLMLAACQPIALEGFHESLNPGKKRNSLFAS